MTSFRLQKNISPTPLEIREVLDSTEVFSSEEVAMAMDLVQDFLEKGSLESGYNFLTAWDQKGRIAGYACFGPIPCTRSSFDLYWIAVHKSCQGRGLGRELFIETEKEIMVRSGTKIYAETSGREDYYQTRRFYQALGFVKLCRLKDFYAPGDDKIILAKNVRL